LYHDSNTLGKVKPKREELNQYPQTVSLRFTLILSFPSHLDVPCGFFHPGLPNKTVYAFLISVMISA
jgi:hypothetical protein